MTLNEADRLKLADIERRLEQDPAIARVFRPRRRTPWKLALPVLCAVLAYLACLVVASLVLGLRIQLLLALAPTAVTLALLLRPGLLQLPLSRRRHR